MEVRDFISWHESCLWPITWLYSYDVFLPGPQSQDVLKPIRCAHVGVRKYTWLRGSSWWALSTGSIQELPVETRGA